MKNLYRLLYRLWHGELTLQNAFWNWAVFGGLIINVASSGLFLFLVMTDRLILALVVGYAISVPYNVVVLVGVWRSAGRFDGERRWADLARIITVIGMVLLSVT
jgi:hypothetical protein